MIGDAILKLKAFDVIIYGMKCVQKLNKQIHTIYGPDEETAHKESHTIETFNHKN